MFEHTARIQFDELDALGVLHHARYVFLVERATIAFYFSCGRPWAEDPRDNPDQVHVVRELGIEYLTPFRGMEEMRVGLWVERMGRTSCTYGFECTDPGRGTVYARGRRAIVKLDPETGRPAPWTDSFRIDHEPLLDAEARGAQDDGSAPDGET